MKIRNSDFAGSWYPATAKACEADIRSFLSDKTNNRDEATQKIGGIVPHAGWFFSGSIACNVIYSLTSNVPPDVIFIYGMHLHPSSKPFIMAEGGWQTPFGVLEIDHDVTQELINQFDFKVETADSYSQDNTIELQLPFIKYFFKDVKIIPVGAPPADISLNIAEHAAKIAIRQKLKALVIGSTDMTHYGANYGFSPKGHGKDALNWVKNENDFRMNQAMLDLDATKIIDEGLTNHNACCSGAVAAAIKTATLLGARQAELLSYSTSYDKSPGSSFVGYSGIVFQ